MTSGHAQDKPASVLANDVAALRKDFDTLRGDLREDLHALRVDVRHTLRDVPSIAARGSGQMLEGLEHRLEARPLPNLLIAFAAGLAIGVFLGRRG